jgi:hypothetical protein
LESSDKGDWIMIGLIRAMQDDNKAVFIEFSTSAKFKMNQPVEVKVKRSIRTLPQNALYWSFLSWCISPEGGDLQSQGHFSIDALHEDIKSWFKSTHKHDFDIDKVFTTTELNAKEFGEYFEIVNAELMIQFFGIDTSGFFKDDYMGGEVDPVPF